MSRRRRIILARDTTVGREKPPRWLTRSARRKRRDEAVGGDHASTRPGKFDARLGDRLLCQSTPTPFCDASRVMLAEGLAEPADTLVMRHAGSQVDALRATVAVAARLTVAEGDRLPRFAPWQPAPAWPKTAPVAAPMWQPDRGYLSRKIQATAGRRKLSFRSSRPEFSRRYPPLIRCWSSRARRTTMFGSCPDLGRLEEAVAATQEAVDIRRRLAQTRPDAFLPDLATSLNNLGIRLSDLGRLEQALAASQEAVDIYRRLAQTRPDAFLPDLAMSISVTSDVLFALDRRTEAAAAARNALETLLPFVERYPDAYEGLAKTIAADLIRYGEAAGIEPDRDLLLRAARALRLPAAMPADSSNNNNPPPLP